MYPNQVEDSSPQNQHISLTFSAIYSSRLLQSFGDIVEMSD